MKKINEFNLGEKIVLGSVVLAIISLFLPWADIGFGSVSGFGQQGFLFLVFFIYPVYKILIGSHYNKVVGVILGTICTVIMVFFAMGNSIEFWGEYENISGSGVYIFIVSSIGFTIGNVLLINPNRAEGIDRDISDIKAYVKNAGEKIGTEVNKFKDSDKEKEKENTIEEQNSKEL